MKDIFFGFLLAFSYFSILPIKIKTFKESELIYKSTLFFIPFVGLILGLLSVILFLILSNFYALWYASLLSGIFYLFLYGFLHLEAIIDVIDGYFASLSNKDVYKIMKEPQVGAIGVVGIVLFLILKLSSIVYFLSLNSNIFQLITVFILSRFSIVFILLIFKLHSKSYFALNLQKNLNLKLFIFALIFYFLLALLFINIYELIILFLLTFIFSFLLIKILNKKIGFINGDILGFNIEILELILINIFNIIAGNVTL